MGPEDDRTTRPLPGEAVVALPAALMVYLSFNAGGFFPGPVAAAGVAVALTLLARALLAADPLEGLSRAGAAAVAALAAFAAWTAVSDGWSDAGIRALLEADRAVLYVVVLALFASLGRTAARAELLVATVVAAIVVVCACALVTRLAPDIWSPQRAGPDGRLSYPLTYANALGLLASLGLVLCVHLAAARRARPQMPILAAGATPLLATTLYLTFSRGALIAAAIGVALYLVVVRPPGLVAWALATVPASWVAVAAASSADLLATPEKGGAAAAQGHRIAVVLGLCCVVAALLRRRADARQRGTATAARHPGRQRAVVVAALVGTVALAAVAFEGSRPRVQAPSVVGAVAPPDIRARTADPGDSGRSRWWRVAWDGAREEPLKGHGAGTFQRQWEAQRPIGSAVTDAHSVYLEVFDELGLVGLVLLLAALLAAPVALARRHRQGHEPVWAALLAAACAWMVHAAVDWDWEMPAVTLWLFAAAGLALARPPGGARRARGPGARAAVIAAGLAALALPLVVGLSQAAFNQSLSAFTGLRCDRAVERAERSQDWLGGRTEADEVIGYCAARAGRTDAAAAAMQRAVAHDPGDWEARYGLAVVLAAGGLDPRPAARAAIDLNPRDPATAKGMVGLLEREGAQQWRAFAGTLRMIIQRFHYPPLGQAAPPGVSGP